MSQLWATGAEIVASYAKRKKVDGEVRIGARVRVKGRPAVSAYFANVADARRWATAIGTDIRRGLQFPELEAQRHTITEAIELYRRETSPNLRVWPGVIQFLGYGPR